MIRALTQALPWAVVPLLAACTSHQHEAYEGDPAAGYYAMPVASRDSIFDYRASPPRADYVRFSGSGDACQLDRWGQP